MPRVSQIQIEAKRMAYFISNLWNTVTLIENREEAVIFLKELLTPTEVRMLAKRVQIAKMLLEGYKYGDIIPHVRVTSTTISSVNNQLQFGNGGYIKIIERLIKIEQRKQKRLEDGKSLSDKVLPFPGGAIGKWLTGQAIKSVYKHQKKKSVEKEII